MKLSIHEKVLGSEHYDIVIGLNELANVFEDQGDLAGARPLYERALAICEKVLGPEHPITLKVRRNLATLTARGG